MVEGREGKEVWGQGTYDSDILVVEEDGVVGLAGGGKLLRKRPKTAGGLRAFSQAWSMY